MVLVGAPVSAQIGYRFSAVRGCGKGRYFAGAVPPLEVGTFRDASRYFQGRSRIRNGHAPADSYSADSYGRRRGFLGTLGGLGDNSNPCVVAMQRPVGYSFSTGRRACRSFSRNLRDRL